MNTNPPDHESPGSDQTGSFVSPPPPPSPASKPLRGVGGWLLFFVIGQLALRPLIFLSRLGRSGNASQIAERFPITSNLLTIENLVQAALMIGGIVVGLSLLKTQVAWPIYLTKGYLVANAAFTVGLAILYFWNDLPYDARSTVIFQGIVTAILVSIISVAWFLYFTQSKRVQITYFAELV